MNSLLNAAWSVSCRGGPISKLVLVRLADRANENCVCWTGKERLAKDCGLSVGAVKKHLRELEAEGHISVAIEGGGRSSNTYRVHPVRSVELHAVGLFGSELWRNWKDKFICFAVLLLQHGPVPIADLGTIEPAADDCANKMTAGELTEFVALARGLKGNIRFIERDGLCGFTCGQRDTE